MEDNNKTSFFLQIKQTGNSITTTITRQAGIQPASQPPASTTTRSQPSAALTSTTGGTEQLESVVQLSNHGNHHGWIWHVARNQPTTIVVYKTENSKTN